LIEPSIFFSVAMHEIGHALGISNGNFSFNMQSQNGYIDILAPLPYAGTRLPLEINNFGITSHLATNRTAAAWGAVMAGSAGG